MSREKPFTVMLVGPGQQENLPLAYLGAAVAAAGYRSRFVRFNERHDKERCVDIVLAEDPALVGISIAFQFAVMDALDLIAALRHRGFTGHITCGGHVPTFCVEDLLRDCSGLDSVVRHEGEETLVALAAALDKGSALSEIPGLVTRGRDGLCGLARTAALVDIDAVTPPMRPSRLFEIGGVPVTFILTSRGCIGECRYCAISAFNRSTAGPRYRLRDPEKVADEIGVLYHRRGGRVFFVQDDLFVLPNARQTLSRIDALTRALTARHVHDAMFWIKGRPETITMEVLDAAWKMGARHLFLGVEHSVERRLSYLGRRHRHRHNLDAIARLKAAKLRPSFNLMIFDPECTLEEVGAVMDFGASCAEIPWNICRTEVYPGTELFRNLKAAGRLQGDYRTYGYTMTDQRAEVLFRILRVSLNEHAFDVDSLLNKLISLSFSRQIHEHYLPGKTTTEVSEAVDRLIVEAHRATVSEIGAAIRFVAGEPGASFASVRRFAAEQAERLAAVDAGRFERVGQMWDYLSARGEAALGQTRRLSRSA